MSIVFYCSHCGARFEVGEQAAGKPGRCKRCGERITVPTTTRRTEHAREPTSVPSVGGVDQLERMGSQVGLVPLTVDRMPMVGRGASKVAPLDDDLGDSKPYAMDSSWKTPVVETPSDESGPAGEATILWRRAWGVIQRLFRRINEFAYLLSVPFLMLLLIGATTHNRGLALLGAEAVVLLNVGRVASGLANILAIPFREGPAVGVLFLIPPFTIKYMIDHWKKLRNPVRRVTSPLLTIAAVALAFAFLPSLSGDDEKTAAVPPASTNQGR